ncbi:MAG: PKD domain-containing protein [Flavobacteriales bacterium]|nr:PKD domain-containing protein [Flavobacteriales bacterium]
MDRMNAFERSVKDSLEPYEVPYNSADWAQLEKALDKGNGSGRVSRAGLYALLFGGATAAATSLYLLLTPQPQVAVVTGHAELDASMESAVEMTTTTMQEINGAESAMVGSKPVGGVNEADPGSNATGVKEITNVKAERSPSTDPDGNEPHLRPGANAGPIVKPSITEGCPGTMIDFAVENAPEGGIYLWNFGDGSFSNKPSPSHAFSKSGNFEVMLSHSSPGGGTIHNKPAADRIIIHEAPEAAFNMLKQEYDNTVPSVHFENRSMGGRTYTWDFGDGSSSNVAHPDHVYKKKGVYQVTLTVTNANGCVDLTERTVRIDSDYDLHAPKTFSPNGDGVDDVFMPEALKTLGVKFNLSVFEAATGQLVYETTDAQRPWNGRINNRGDQCSSGDYVWMVEMKDGDKLGGTYNGSIDLMR